MNRKLLSIFMSVALLFGSFGMAFGADVTTSAASNFFDMPDNWSTAALNKAVDNGLLTGYAEGGKKLIKAGNSLTRAEMAAVVNRAFASEKKSDLSKVNDVSSSAWYAKDMAKAVKMGTFAYSSKMRPGDKITRQEVFTALARAFKLVGTNAEHTALDVFSDKDEIASWALKSLDGMVAAGYIQGSSGKLKPTANITRAEFATVMDNLVKDYIDVAGDVTKVVAKGNVIVRTPGVVLKDVTVKGDLIIADGVGEGDVTLDNVKVEGRTVVRGGGVDSIIVKGGSDIARVIVAKVDGEVRIHVESGAKIEVIYVDDGSDDVTVEGKFGNLEVAGEGVTVYAKDADVNNAIVSGDNSKIIVGDGSKVKNGSITGDSSAIVVDEGGSVDTVAVSGDNATVGGKPVEAGQTVDGSGEPVTPPSRPSTPQVSAISMATDVFDSEGNAIEYYDLSALPYGAEVTVILETATQGAKIYYTEDGTNPDPAKSEEYDGSFTIKADDGIETAVEKTIKVLARKAGYTDWTEEFTINFKPKHFTLNFDITIVNDEGSDLVSAEDASIVVKDGWEENALEMPAETDGTYKLETDKWYNYTITTTGDDYTDIMGQATGPEDIGDSITLEITLVKVAYPDSKYYSAEEELEITISKLRHEQSDVKVGMPIYTGLGPPWASSQPVLNTMTEVEEILGGEKVQVLWSIGDTNEEGILTISGKVGEDLPYGSLRITLPDYGYTINNPLPVLEMSPDVGIRLGGFAYVADEFGHPVFLHDCVIVGQTLSAAIKPFEASETVAYQWQRADTEDGEYEDITDAIEVEYTIAEKDFGKWIRVKATSKDNDDYYWGTVYSYPVGPVEAEEYSEYEFTTFIKGEEVDIGEEVTVLAVDQLIEETSVSIVEEVDGEVIHHEALDTLVKDLKYTHGDKITETSYSQYDLPPRSFKVALKATEVKELGYENVKIQASTRTKDGQETNDLQIWMYNLAGDKKWWNIGEAGWGNEGDGFKLDPNKNKEMEAYVFGTTPGTYEITLEAVDTSIESKHVIATGTSNVRVIALSKIKKNYPQGYYSAGKKPEEKLEFTITGLKSNEKVEVVMRLQKRVEGPGNPWFDGDPVALSDSYNTEEDGSLTVETGEVQLDLPYGHLQIILPEYGYHIDRNIGLVDLRFPGDGRVFVGQVCVGGAVSVGGIPVVGQELKATNLQPERDDYERYNVNVVYQWQKADTKDGEYTDIPNATGETYTVAKDDLWIRVKATSDSDGTHHWGTVASEPVEIVDYYVTPRMRPPWMGGSIIRVGEEIKICTGGVKELHADDLRIMLWAGELDSVQEAKDAYYDDYRVFSSRIADLVVGGMDIKEENGVFIITIDEAFIDMLVAGTRYGDDNEAEINKYTWNLGDKTTWIITPATTEDDNGRSIAWEDYDTWDGSKVNETFFVYTLDR